MFKELIIQMSQEANAAGKPVELCFGTVTGVDPLVVQITPNLIVKEEAGQIVVPLHCTDHKVNITLESPEDGAVQWRWQTEQMGRPGNDPTAYDMHAHWYQPSGTLTITLHEKLKQNDIVLMGRVQGGQKYFIFDKVG